jgi:spore coat protein U-like protein
MKKVILALTVAAFGLAFSGTANAVFTKTATATMNIDATITASCSVSATSLSFGTYDGTAPAYSTSTISVTCSPDVPYRVDIDKGGATPLGGDVSTREARNPTNTNTLMYWLYKTNSHLPADEWGDNGATYCTTCTTTITGLSGTGNGTPQPLTVYGEADGSATALPVADTYTDTVTVTVNY